MVTMDLMTIDTHAYAVEQNGKNDESDEGYGAQASAG